MFENLKSVAIQLAKDSLKRQGGCQVKTSHEDQQVLDQSKDDCQKSVSSVEKTSTPVHTE